MLDVLISELQSKTIAHDRLSLLCSRNGFSIKNNAILASVCEAEYGIKQVSSVSGIEICNALGIVYAEYNGRNATEQTKAAIYTYAKQSVASATVADIAPISLNPISINEMFSPMIHTKPAEMSALDEYNAASGLYSQFVCRNKDGKNVFLCKATR